jgi:hypothetical protein
VNEIEAGKTNPTAASHICRDCYANQLGAYWNDQQNAWT